MGNEVLKNNFINATKWSTITEVVAKLINPITNMILARILAPEAFGVIATVTMVISFADMFTDAGFQKYLIQHEFKSQEEKFRNADVAFWTNFAISIFLWFLIIVFRNPIANLVGNPGLGNVIAIASVQLLLTSFSSIQMALYKRKFDFKTLFIVRIISVIIPFAITIPLALLGFSYWSLIIGSIIIQLSNAVILTIKSQWKPHFFYSLDVLKDMISFSIWSLIEAISIWFTAWIDMFIIGSSLNQYYLGIYKTSISMVNALMAIIASSIIPVLFSALSRLQDNNKEFNKLYFKTQRAVSLLVFPLGIGVYLYSNIATEILLGNKWIEASEVIGIWALTSSIVVVLSNLCSEVYRAKGRPKLSFLSQVLHLIVLVPVCIISSHYGFRTLVYSRALVRFEGVLINFIIMKIAFKFSIGSVIKNVMSTGISALCMGGIGILLKLIGHGLMWDIFSIIICALSYVGFLLLFPSMRKEIYTLVGKFKLKFAKTKSFAN